MLITRENGYCLECEYPNHKIELTLKTLQMNEYYVYVLIHLLLIFMLSSYFCGKLS